MDFIRVHGGTTLQGKVKVQGSKNAALPILAATLLVQGPVLLKNCPKISDVDGMILLLQTLGCSARWERDALCVCTDHYDKARLPDETVGAMRSSVFLLGAILARKGEAILGWPGGCVIGKRPIDLHIKVLTKMGVRFRETDEGICAIAENGLHGISVELDFPSVGVTENLVMAATAADGLTRIKGAAKEPEVTALCEFLKKCGAFISGIGTDILEIRGGSKLHGGEFRIPSDRIVAGTYLFAGLAAGGSILLEEAPTEHMQEVLRVIRQMGGSVTETAGGLYAQFTGHPQNPLFLKTDVYPGFPTDLQSMAVAAGCVGEGDFVVQETIFENRFRIIKALESMGGRICRIDDGSVRIIGRGGLRGAEVEALELRGGAALIVAALGAKGETVISGRRYIERGYENICRDLRELGARIVSG